MLYNYPPKTDIVVSKSPPMERKKRLEKTVMVRKSEDNSLSSAMDEESDDSKRNTYSSDSATGYGVQIRRGRRVHLAKAARGKKRKVKMPKIQNACSCAANCNCKCIKCICQQKIAAAGNAEVIRARKQARKKKEKSDTPTGSNLVNQLTALVQANRKRANEKKKQENEPTPSGEGNKPNPAEVKSGGRSGGSMSNKSEAQLNDPGPDPTYGNPAHDMTMIRDKKYMRKRKQYHTPYASTVDRDVVKPPKRFKHQGKKKRANQTNVSPPPTNFGTAGHALVKIRRLRKQAREKNHSPKSPKKPHQ